MPPRTPDMAGSRTERFAALNGLVCVLDVPSRDHEMLAGGVECAKLKLLKIREWPETTLTLA